MGAVQTLIRILICGGSLGLLAGSVMQAGLALDEFTQERAFANAEAEALSQRYQGESAVLLSNLAEQAGAATATGDVYIDFLQALASVSTWLLRPAIRRFRHQNEKTDTAGLRKRGPATHVSSGGIRGVRPIPSSTPVVGTRAAHWSHIELAAPRDPEALVVAAQANPHEVDEPEGEDRLSDEAVHDATLRVNVTVERMNRYRKVAHSWTLIMVGAFATSAAAIIDLVAHLLG